MKYINEIEKMGFAKLTPIQTEIINNFNNKRNLVGVAPTGTGKTHAYLIPLIGNIDVTKDEVQAIIIVPTNELVNQVKRMVEPLSENIKIKSYDSKIDKGREIAWLDKYQPQLVISTPERLIDLSNNGLKINTSKYFVLDEADMMFDESFLKQIDLIIGRVSTAKFLLFSATITENMHMFIKKYFGVYDLIDTSKDHKLKIEHRLVKASLDNRIDTLNDLLRVLNPYLAIIFVSKKEDQTKIFDLLLDKGLSVTQLSSSLNQHQRKRVINDIIDLKYQYVVASDLAARGLDFDVSHVINYDLPYKLEFFKHRSGRTGRMEKEGIVITIVDNNDRNKVKRLEEMGFKFNEYRISSSEMIILSKEPKNKITNDELNAMKRIPKPKKVKPNYRKKNGDIVKSAKREVRRKNYAKNR
ncbi:DEAD/DEAH box helicase [Haploplasma axanthum]|uniref:DEAD-box ATP-dependent RNA helicase n=1 Tax=Haploplasma axanthum TaxID=29552 RepID=A0A449BDW0_HAPAX|nr:DEAD/DEAH box helicase [Haploplasma axanthum]VEU80615.1 DEAD-box ATP-dependent RNA helicase [Haploplasma axanthum]